MRSLFRSIEEDRAIRKQRRQVKANGKRVGKLIDPYHWDWKANPYKVPSYSGGRMLIKLGDLDVSNAIYCYRMEELPIILEVFVNRRGRVYFDRKYSNILGVLHAVSRLLEKKADQYARSV